MEPTALGQLVEKGTIALFHETGIDDDRHASLQKCIGRLQQIIVDLIFRLFAVSVGEFIEEALAFHIGVKTDSGEFFGTQIGKNRFADPGKPIVITSADCRFFRRSLARIMYRR